MSERGSICTEYVYCDACFAAAKEVLLSDDKYLRTVVIPMWSSCDQSPELPIIAGKIGGLYAGEEIHFAEQLLNLIAPKLCPLHEVRFAVMPDSADPVFLVARGPGLTPNPK